MIYGGNEQVFFKYKNQTECPLSIRGDNLVVIKKLKKVRKRKKKLVVYFCMDCGRDIT